MATSKTGIWLDKLTGKISTTEPERAKVLVHPGAEIPEAVQATLDARTQKAAAPEKAPAKQTRGK